MGEIILRIERTGLEITNMKLTLPNESVIDQHYLLTEEWAKGVFDKAKVSFESQGKEFSHTDHMQYGKQIQDWNKKFLKEGKILSMVIEGHHAIEIIRKIVGPTNPKTAPPGTIRGDYLFESTALANEQNRTLRNLIHASGSVEEAEREINLWFND